LAGSTAVLFPVDDLWGKVDVPIVLLESMKLGVPVIAINHGPLADLGGAELVAHGDRVALGRAAIAMAKDVAARHAVVERQLPNVTQFDAPRIAELYEGLYLELFART
jgi:phosphatidylinositol alpha-1,6-mannosyltransferase